MKLIFTCYIYRKIFSTKCSLQKQISGKHSGQSILKCPVCSKDFTTKANVQKHLTYQRNGWEISTSFHHSPFYFFLEIHDPKQISLFPHLRKSNATKFQSIDIAVKRRKILQTYELSKRNLMENCDIIGTRILKMRREFDLNLHFNLLK